MEAGIEQLVGERVDGVTKVFKVNLSRFAVESVEYFQTKHAAETIAVIRYSDGSISIGIARAGRADRQQRRVTPESGMKIALGRARKAAQAKGALIEKNYLRGIYAPRSPAYDLTY